jgi:hypothetical protein
MGYPRGRAAVPDFFKLSMPPASEYASPPAELCHAKRYSIGLEDMLMSKSRSHDQATHGGGKRDAERQSSDANELGRDGLNKPRPNDDERSRMEKGTRVGPNSDPDDLGQTDLERRAAAANRDPAEGAREK